MNTESSPCESMSEAISLLAAGCANDDEAVAVRQHLKECESCRESYSRLQALCQGLSLPPANDESVELGFVTRALDEIEGDTSVRIGQSSPRSSWAQLFAVIALGLLIAVAGRLFPAIDNQMAVNPPLAVGPASPVVTDSKHGVPSLLALRGAADSEAELDRLLAQAYPPLQSTHLGLPLFDKELSK